MNTHFVTFHATKVLCSGAQPISVIDIEFPEKLLLMGNVLAVALSQSSFADVIVLSDSWSAVAWEL